MKRAVTVILALLLAGGAGGFSFYRLVYSNQSGRSSSDSSNAVYVDSVSFLAGLDSAMGRIERFAGVVEPQETWEVKLDTDLTIEDTFVKVGDTVKQGDVLFKYSTIDSEQKIAQDQIDLERNRNNIDADNQTIANFQRQLNTVQSEEERLELQTQILQKQNDIKTTEYDIQTKELEIATLQEKMKSAEVVCELDGVVRSINTSSGSSSYSDSGSDAYMTIMGTGDYRIKCMINEQQMGMIYVGENMLVFSRQDPSKYWTGVLTEIRTQDGTSGDNNMYGSGSSDNSLSSTNYPFYIQLEDSEDLILGQHVYVEEDVGQKAQKEGIWLPDYYFLTEEEGSFVWTASGRNTLEKREVVLGEYDEDTMCYEVLEGLTAEDYIAAAAQELTEGLPVVYNEVSADDAGYEEYVEGVDEDGSVYMFDEFNMDDELTGDFDVFGDMDDPAEADEINGLEG